MSSDEDLAVGAFVATLHDLEERLAPEPQVSLDPELGFHQLEALRTFVWGGVDPLVRFYVPRFVERGGEMHPDHMNECLDIATDEYVVKGSRLIMRRWRSGNHVGLNELAVEVYDPSSPEHDDYRERLRDNILYRMRDIGIWEFSEEYKVSPRTGTTYHAGFKITAGPTLRAFHKHIYMKYAKRFAKVEAKLLEAMGD